MADRFDEAPPLPRQPTALSVPDAMGNPANATAATMDTSTISETLPPPPKFPSLTDVDLATAKSAAEAQGIPQQAPVDTSLLSTVTTDTSAQTFTDTQPLTETQPPPTEAVTTPTPTTTTTAATTEAAAAATSTTTTTTSLRPTSVLHEDIEAAIQRASVTPGTGERKVIELRERLWTSSDQAELEKLLADGNEVYVPPDVERNDLPHPHAASYLYVPKPSSEPAPAPVDTSTDPRSVADRIAVWNQVVKEDVHDPRSLAKGAGAAAVASAAAGTAAGAAIAEAEDADDSVTAAPASQVKDVKEALPTGDTTTRDMATPQSTAEGTGASAEKAAPTTGTTARSNADVSRSIFGGPFFTVPVTSRKAGTDEIGLTEGTLDDDEAAKTTEIKLRSDASAQINIKDDYGLKGGHTVGCNDAVFLGNKNTLLTCGADGKVCIWDMSDRTVSKEFVPYDGEPVTMVHPMTDEDDGDSHTVMTLSQNRLMRIWAVDNKQAVMLRSTPIQASEKDLYMSVPVISKELKVRAAAAAAAAAVQTTDAPVDPVGVETAEPENAPPSETIPAEVPDVETATQTPTQTAVETASLEEPKEEEKERKRFSFTKVLSFGRSSSRKAVAS